MKKYTLVVVAIIVCLVVLGMVLGIPPFDRIKTTIFSSLSTSSQSQTSFDAAFIKLPGPAAIYSFDASDAFDNISESGASKANVGKVDSYNLEGHRIAYLLIAGGVVANNSEYLDRGLKSLEWGFDKMAPDGSFPGERSDDPKDAKYLNVHPLSFFDEAAAHSVLLILNSDVPQEFKDRATALVPKIHTAAVWMNNPTNINDFAENGVDTNMLTTIAAFFEEAGVLTNDPALIAAGKSLVEKILARQLPDGTFPEKGGFDSTYHSVSLDFLTRYAVLIENDPTWKATVTAAVIKGYDREMQAIKSDGTIDTTKNSRTLACGPAVPGTTPKGRDIDTLPLRLYLFGYFTDRLSFYSPIAQKVLIAGQGFDHIEQCKNPTSTAAPKKKAVKGTQ